MSLNAGVFNPPEYDSGIQFEGDFAKDRIHTDRKKTNLNTDVPPF